MPSLQMGKPYLDPANVAIPKAKPSPKPAIVNKPRVPPKPAPVIDAKPAKTAIAKVEPGIKNAPEKAISKDGVSTGIKAPAVSRGAAPGLQPDSGDNGIEAIPVFKMEPRYPRKAARRRIEGWVKVEFTITESGTVTNAVAVESKPRRTFDRSAVQAIRKWRFKPKIVDGKPVQRKASQVIEFRLTRG